MKKNFYFFVFYFILNYSISCQEAKISYLELIDSSIKEKKVFKKELDNNISSSKINSIDKVDKMAISNDCEIYYSKHARLSCMNNNVFKSIYKHLEYPHSIFSEKPDDIPFGSVIFSYIINEEGYTVPYSVYYSSEKLKNSVLLALNKWFEENKYSKSTPAMVDGKPVSFMSEVIFSYILDDSSNTTDKALIISDIIKNTSLKKNEIIKVKKEKKVKLVKPIE